MPIITVFLTIRKRQRMFQIKHMQSLLVKIAMDRPWLGFATSLGITATGTWTVIESFLKGATLVGGFLMMLVGLVAAILNARVQRLAREKLELEVSILRRQESGSARSQEPSLQDSSSPSRS